MGRRQHPPTPAVGSIKKWRRNGHEVKDAEGQVLLQGKSLRQAKRFFRTGSKGRDPEKVAYSARVGPYIPRGRH